MRSRRRVCQIIACQRCWQQHRYQEQWTKRTISCSLIRGGPIGKVLVPVVTEMSSTRATRLLTSITPWCLHKQGIIAGQIILYHKETQIDHWKGKAMIHKYHVYNFPKGK